MYRQILMMLIITAIGVVAIAASKFLRTVVRECIVRRREHCKINRHPEKRRLCRTICTEQRSQS
jgi:hypothetical protein